MSKSASVSSGRGGIILESEVQRQALREGESGRSEMQVGGGIATGERAPRQALAGNSRCGGGGETAQRQALGEGAGVSFGDFGDGTEAIAGGSATAQRQALGEGAGVSFGDAGDGTEAIAGGVCATAQRQALGEVARVVGFGY